MGIQSMPSVPISPSDRDTIGKFIDEFLKSPYYGPVLAVLNEEEAEAARLVPGFPWGSRWLAPSMMLSGPPDAEGKAPWHPVDSPIDEEMIAGFERFLNVPLPPLFKAYL